MRAPKTIRKIGWAGTKGSTTSLTKDTKNPYKFIPKTNYSKEDIDCLFQTVTSNTISSLDKLDILEKAVAPCPEINIQIKDQQESQVASCRAVFFLVLSYLQCFLVYLLQYLKDTINIIPQTTIRYEILCENRVTQI